MTAPADYSNLYSRTRRPRSPQGDGAYDANGMSTSTGQQGQGQLDEPARPYNPQQPTSHPQPQQGFQANTPPGPGNQGGAQTFSQMQAQGQARPLPPTQQAGPSSQTPTYQPSQQQNQLGNQLQQSVSQTLAAPTRYDLPQVQQVRDALTAQLQTQYAGQQKQINDQLASRGLLSSSIAGGYYGDLATNQANSLADMNAKLIQDAAATNAADRSSALASAQNLSNSQSAQGIAGYNANLAGQNQAQQFGIQQGGLTGMYNGQQTLAGQAQAQQNAVQVGGLTGQYVAPGSTGAGQSTLGAQQLSQSGQQFAQNLALQSQLGFGNLGVAQQQANTGAAAQQSAATLGQAQLAQSGQQFQQNFAQNASQFGQTYALQQAQQDLQAQVQTGQLSIAQANQQLAQLQNSQQFGLAQGSQNIAQQQANTQQQQVAGQLGLGQAQLAQSGQQFQQNFAQNASQFGQTYALQQAQQDLNKQVQTGQLTIAQAQQKLAELSNTQQFGLAQGSQNIAQQQANTATAAQQAQAQYQQGQLGVAEKQVALQDSQFQQNFTQNVSQFGQTYALQKAASDLQNKVQLGQLDNQTAQQALAELTQKTQATQQNASIFGQGAKYDAATGSYVDASGKPLTTLQAQQLAQQGQQNTMNNNLSFMQLLNSPTGALASSTNSTFAPDFIAQLYKSLGIDTSAKAKTSTSNATDNTTGSTTGATGGATGGGSNTGTGDGSTGSTTGGEEIFNTRKNSVAPDLGQQAFMVANPNQQGLMSRQMTPEQLAQMNATPQGLVQYDPNALQATGPEGSGPLRSFSSGQQFTNTPFQATNPNLQPLSATQLPQGADTSGQMGMTPDQLAQLQRMLGIGDAQMASTY